MQNPTIPERPPRARRPSRSQAGPASGFEALDEAHRAALAMLGVFKRLVDHLGDQGLDVKAEQLAVQVLNFFDGPGKHHHDDEERLVFPDLLALGDDELVTHVRRLQQDHGWIEQDWRELSPHVKAIAQGYNGYELPLLQAALPVFEALYLDHIALEENVVYPAARHVKETLARRGSAAVG